MMLEWIALNIPNRVVLPAIAVIIALGVYHSIYYAKYFLWPRHITRKEQKMVNARMDQLLNLRSSTEVSEQHTSRAFKDDGGKNDWRFKQMGDSK